MHISIAEPGGPTMRWLMSVFFLKVSFTFFFLTFFKVPHVNPRVSGLVTLSLAAASLDEASLDKVAHVDVWFFFF